MKSEQKKLMSGFILMGTSSGLRIVFGMIGVMIAARVLPEEELGGYYLIFSVAILLEMVLNLGLNMATTKTLAEASDPLKRQEIISTVFWIRLGTLLLLLPVALVAQPILARIFDESVYGMLLVYIPILVAVRLIYATLWHMLQGYHFYHQLAFINTLLGGLNLAFTALLVVAFHFGVVGYMQAMIISMFVVCIMLYLLLPKQAITAFDFATAKSMLRLGFPLQANDLFTQFVTRLDVWLLGAMATATSVAYLEVAARTPNYVSEVFSTTLTAIYFPRMSELLGIGDKEAAASFLNRVLRLLAFATMSAALVLTFFQREITIFIFTERYLPSAPAMGIVMIGIAFALATQVLEVALIAAGRPSYLLVNKTLMSGLTVITNLLLIPLFGFMGAVYARALTNIFTFPAAAWETSREKLGAEVYPVFGAVMSLASCMAIYYYFDIASQPYLVKCSICLLFLVLAFATSIIRMDDIRLLIQLGQAFTQRGRASVAVSS